MDESLESAVEDHLDAPGRMTGYMLLTFHDGEVECSSAYMPSDAVAERVIQELVDAISARDEIGTCEGSA